MEKWFVAAKKADFNEIGKKFNISPIVARIIRNRDIISEDEIEKYLFGTLKDLHSPYLMKNMEKAVLIINEKIKEGKKIRIIGDYDIDGVNATHILLTGLKNCGASVDTKIPDRMKDGYGINEKLILTAFDQGIDTIVTCDNGISAISQIKYAKDLGMTVVVTDHHDIPYIEDNGEKKYLESEADAIVNPKQLDCNYPFKELCGAAVAYKLVEAMYEENDIKSERVTDLIEFAAIATVGDVMDLKGENRIIVKYGLERLKKTKNLGLRALIGVNNIQIDRLSSYHIGFVLGPCINASGRLDTAKRALELLNASTIEEASLIAGDLKALNDSRKELTLLGVEEAVEQVETSEIKNDKILIIYLPECHESLAGIIAGRIREKYNKPVFVLTKGEEGVKGSGRSIEAYHMFEEMTKCKHLFIKFGGHPMAAGLSMEEENIGEMRKLLNDNSTLVREDFIPKVSIDVPMPIEYVSEMLIEQLDLLEPFGKGNTKPVFAEKNLKIKSLKVIGKNKNVIKMKIKNNKVSSLDAMYFGDVEDFYQYILEKYTKETAELLFSGRECDIEMAFTYYPSLNEFNGKKYLQVVIQNYQ